ncbi:hypothetical protein [Edaphobacter sp.]|uniref:hypothetical protein n=1 Tax=Edaphobacter sp. TaxID=1934404 RepID=UPI002DBDDC20|nr:hypothetical protein [Edaphobacter sp.]HEU5342676.1 hypothetical protein [Edaphobacter sp.]
MVRWLFAAVVLLYAVRPAMARSVDDRVSLGGDITIAAGETGGDVVCVFCSIHIHGDTRGDVVAVLGSVTVDSGHRIGGDVAVIGGDLNLGPESEVGGDVSVIAGSPNLAEDAAIHGSRTVIPGRAWLLLPFAPLLILVGIIWLIVYLVRRARYSYPAYPGPRRY